MSNDTQQFVSTETIGSMLDQLDREILVALRSQARSRKRNWLRHTSALAFGCRVTSAQRIVRVMGVERGRRGAYIRTLVTRRIEHLADAGAISRETLELAYGRQSEGYRIPLFDSTLTPEDAAFLRACGIHSWN